MQPILINGQWQESADTGSFRAMDPSTGTTLPDEFPISSWTDCDAALAAAATAAAELRRAEPEQIAVFLESYADQLDAARDSISAIAALETGLPVAPRLKDVELKRTTNQLRAAGEAAREGSWSLPTIDTAHALRSYFASIGPVIVIGPNNFPLAFNSVSGGDFAAAVAAGNPVIAKGHPSHPATTRQLAEIGLAALEESELPLATLQLLYHVPPEVGLKLVADRRVGAVGFTGSKTSGLALKAACDAAGKPIYLEMSSINPVVILPGALQSRAKEIGQQLLASCTAAAGQMCTSPGLVFMVAGPEAQSLEQQLAEQFRATTPGTLLSAQVRNSLEDNVERIKKAGATLVVGGRPVEGSRMAYEPTLLRISGRQFLEQPEMFQTEMFGTATMLVTAATVDEMVDGIERLEGNLTGAVYSAEDGSDRDAYDHVTSALRPKVGRLMDDKMPTGVTVSPAMQHGGPYPASGHPGFTAVGIPTSMRRFAMLQCFDHVRQENLPLALRDRNPNGRMVRSIDGRWTTADVSNEEVASVR